jgi:hypothetical protein
MLFPTKTLEFLREAFGERSLSRTEVFEWHLYFKASQVSIEDEERSGLPSTSRPTENVETFPRAVFSVF